MITRAHEQTKSIREYMHGGKKYVKQTTLSKSLPPHTRMFSVLRLIPGASIGYHMHEGESEMFYFVEGCGRVQDDDQFYDVNAGDSMITFSGHGHGVENTGDEDLVIVAAIILDE